MRYCVPIVLLVLMELPCLLHAQDGKTLFMHQWTSGDQMSHQGDGLGPVFNGNSCFQCHHQGGIGGGGDIDQNLDFLSNTSQKTIDKLRLIRAHSGFQNRDGLVRDTIILHRFSLDAEYTRIRGELLEFDGATCSSERERQRLQRAAAVVPVQQIHLDNTISAVRTQRNSTALFGAGLINQISDRALLHLASQHKPVSTNVSGRLSVVGMDRPGESIRLGRFGWRGQTSRLGDFVMDACAFELGLELDAREQTPDPRDRKYRPPGVDLTTAQVNELTRFVSELARPTQQMPDEASARERVKLGQQVFHKTGCADCHIETVAGIQGIYTDFMLHDMGDSLADPVPASRAMTRASVARLVGHKVPTHEELKFARGKGRTHSGSYGGGSTGSPFPVFAKAEFEETNTTHEWQTPPLWGIADSAPYMHDGRAATLVEAIAAHGGEATDSVEAYFSARIQDQLTLVEFLKTLRAPGEN